jgi:hypothetical protein
MGPAQFGCPGDTLPFLLRFDHQQLTGRNGGTKIFHGAFGDDLAPIQDADPLAEPFGFIQQMGGEQNRQPLLLEVADQAPQIMTGLHIQARGGLIEDQQLRPVNQGDRQAEATLHTTAEGFGPAAGSIPQTHQFQGVGGPDPSALSWEGRRDGQRS